MNTLVDLQPKLWKDNCKEIQDNGTEAEEIHRTKAQEPIIKQEY